MTQTATTPKPQPLTLIGNLPIKLKIDIWSDIYCPWCYIGKRRLEKALTQFEHRDQVEINWHSFQLDPEAPAEYPGSINAMLADKKGISPQRAEQLHAHLTALAAQEGLDYRFDKVRVGNSLNAHRLMHFAAQHNLQGQMKERLFHAYFTEGLPVGDPETLAKLGAEVGLDIEAVRQMLAGPDFTDAVYDDHREALQIGVQGVPFFVFAQKYAVSGAQPVEVFTTALQRTWDDLQATGLCADDSCAVF